jgi:thiamine-monophosphate kinase
LRLVEELGEHRIVEVILESLEVMPNMSVPFGDDVSAVDIGGGKLAVIKTDMLVGKTDVPQGMNLWQAARKAVVMNISDLAAKGTKPQAVLAAIGLPRGLTENDIEQLGKGLNDGARQYGAYVIGGDTNEASDLVISCTAFGTCKKRSFMRRSGAKPGDLVATTGVFGKTSAGLEILLEGLSASSGGRKQLVEAVLMPKARLKEGLALAETGAVSASIDASDGLAWSLHEISRASHVGFLIDALPIAEEAEKFAEAHILDAKELALYGGEEYELVVTVKPDRWNRAEAAVKKVGGSLMKIGTVTSKPNVLFKAEKETVAVEARGWEHFKTPDREI